MLFMLMCITFRVQRYTLFFEKQNVFLFYFIFIYLFRFYLNVSCLCVIDTMVAERFANLEFLERVAIPEG